MTEHDIYPDLTENEHAPNIYTPGAPADTSRIIKESIFKKPLPVPQTLAQLDSVSDKKLEHEENRAAYLRKAAAEKKAYTDLATHEDVAAGKLALVLRTKHANVNVDCQRWLDYESNRVITVRLDTMKVTTSRTMTTAELDDQQGKLPGTEPNPETWQDATVQLLTVAAKNWPDSDKAFSGLSHFAIYQALQKSGAEWTKSQADETLALALERGLVERRPGKKWAVPAELVGAAGVVGDAMTDEDLAMLMTSTATFEPPTMTDEGLGVLIRQALLERGPLSEAKLWGAIKEDVGTRTRGHSVDVCAAGLEAGTLKYASKRWEAVIPVVAIGAQIVEELSKNPLTVPELADAMDALEIEVGIVLAVLSTEGTVVADDEGRWSLQGGSGSVLTLVVS